MAKAVGLEGLVLRCALLSRLLLLTLILLWRLLFRPYDTSASLNPSCLSSSSTAAAAAAAAARSVPSGPILWPRIGASIEASVVWDGVYFVRIAECGYEYEQTYAFFPLLPLCISLLSRFVFAPLVPMIGYRPVLALSGYVLNNVAFLFAAVYFYRTDGIEGRMFILFPAHYQSALRIPKYLDNSRLSVLILKDPAAAFRASILFCFNPASVFYSSIYTESLYALFSVGGLYYLFSGANTVAMLLLALSGSARSNGVLNAGYFCFQPMQHAYDAIIQKKRPILAVRAIIGGLARSLCIFVPFLAFQAYGYSNICLGGISYEPRPWCKARIPNLYGFLQSHYWGVGFLRYFQVKQLPNFLLASPILSLSICSIIHYANMLLQVVQSLNTHDHNSFAALLSLLGTNEISDAVGASKNSSPSKSSRDHMVRRRKQERKDKSTESFQHLRSTDHALLQSMQGYPSVLVLPFILHLAFMTFTALFMMHVQVSTRFLSASPPIYWFASCVLVSPSCTSRRWGYLIWVYFITFILLGSLLFSNFYPFT